MRAKLVVTVFKTILKSQLGKNVSFNAGSEKLNLNDAMWKCGCNRYRSALDILSLTIALAQRIWKVGIKI